MDTRSFQWDDHFVPHINASDVRKELNQEAQNQKLKDFKMPTVHVVATFKDLAKYTEPKVGDLYDVLYANNDPRLFEVQSILKRNGYEVPDIKARYTVLKEGGGWVLVSHSATEALEAALAFKEQQDQIVSIYTRKLTWIDTYCPIKITQELNKIADYVTIGDVVRSLGNISKSSISVQFVIKKSSEISDHSLDVLLDMDTDFEVALDPLAKGSYTVFVNSVVKKFRSVINRNVEQAYLVHVNDILFKLICLYK